MKIKIDEIRQAPQGGRFMCVSRFMLAKPWLLNNFKYTQEKARSAKLNGV